MVQHKCPAAIPAGRWRDLWKDCLNEIGDVTRAEARLLERMILNLMSADFALSIAAKDPVVVGSTGQLVENSQFKVAARCDGQALSIARQLKLTTLTKGGGDQPAGSGEEADPFAVLDAEAEGRKST